MSTPTSPNSPDPSAESESRAPEAPDVNHTDPTLEPATQAPAEPALEPALEPPVDTPAEPATKGAAAQGNDQTTEYPAEFWNEPATVAVDTPTGPSGPGESSIPEPKRPSGPHLPAILLGVACLIVAVIAIAQELGRLTIDWGNVGPLGIVTAGAVLVVLGLVGLMASRKN